MKIIFEFAELVGGILASIIVIIYFYEKYISPLFAKIEIQLTKDFYFSLTQFGELFSPKVIIYSPIVAKITDCSFELKCKKTGNQNTSYTCRAERFGSVERVIVGTESWDSFYFPKRSPDFLLGKEENKEILIQCNVIGSKETIVSSVNSFVTEYRKRLVPAALSPINFKAQLHDCSTDILSSIKLGQGEHTLVCKITYKYKHLFCTRKKIAESEVTMNISKDSWKKYHNKESIENFLRDFLASSDPQNRGINIRQPFINPDFD